MQNTNEKVILYVLVLLTLNNLMFLILSSRSGSVVRFAVAAGAGVHWWIRRHPGFMILLALVWIFLHTYQLIRVGAGSYPVFFYLNLLLPIPLLCCSLGAYLLAKKR